MASREHHRIKAVLFDMDDTLIDWSGLQGDINVIELKHWQNVYNYLLELNCALPPFNDFWQQFREAMIDAWTEAKKSWAGVSMGQLLHDFLQNYGLDMTKINVTAVLQAYDWGPLPGVAPFDDAIPVLEHLKQAGYKIGLITNAMQPMWMRDLELRAYGLLDYLDARLTSGDVGYMKPHPFIYWQALEQLDVLPEESVFVGDRPANDIAGANKAGLTSVLMAPPHLNRELHGVRPNFTITKLEELLPILAQLSKSQKNA